MKRRVAGLIAAAALLGGCSGSSANLVDLLTLPGLAGKAEPAASAAPSETGSLALRPGPHEPQETTALVPDASPTSVFADVARGALGCWFAADGPLKASHVYRADARPPAKGGDAEILIYERDAAVRDLRGPRAYRVAFAAEMSGVRVTMLAQRFEPKIAQAMAKDVASWAQGGEGCELRALLAPPPPAPKAAAKKKATQSAAKAPPAPKTETAGVKPK